MSYPSALHDVLDHVIAPAGELAYQEGKFPRAAVAALGRAGLLGLTCSAEPAGGGADLARAADGGVSEGRAAQLLAGALVAE
ncbi:acyl-CoA dehydrogenase family protein, partial [Streptomyces sp. NPDC002922]|uniref:acyl-CoA dehydrogenase family protein n=1 Tax=Streptomyces sp. NPDC002922 TaxID=3154439 RepID=UPI0033BDA557